MELANEHDKTKTLKHLPTQPYTEGIIRAYQMLKSISGHSKPMAASIKKKKSTGTY